MNKEEEVFTLIKENDPNKLSSFIKKNVDIINFNYENERNKTIFDYLIKFNNHSLISFILSKKKINLYRNTHILKYPIKHQFNKVVKNIINYDNKIILFNDNHNLNAFLYSIKYNNFEILEFLYNSIEDTDKNKYYTKIIYKSDSLFHYIFNTNITNSLKIFNILHIDKIQDYCNNDNETILMCLYKNIKEDTEDKHLDFINKINKIIQNPLFNIQESINNKTLLHFLIDIEYYKTVLFYLNKIIANKLDYNINTQDIKGQTIFHLLLRQLIKDNKNNIQSIIEILNLLFNNINTFKPNFNIYDIKLKTPIYLILKIDNLIFNNNKNRRDKDLKETLTICTKKLILNSNLNLQTLNFYSPLHLITKYKFYNIFSEELKVKKLNITLKNKDNKLPFDYLTNDKDFNDFFNIYFDSYIFNIQKNKYINNSLNKSCFSDIQNNKIESCKSKLIDKIKNKEFEDLNIIKYKIDIKTQDTKNNNISFIYFGSSIDIIYVCKMLNKNNSVYFPHEKKINSNSQFPIIQFYKSNNLIVDNESIIDDNFIFWYPNNNSLFINPYLIHKIIKKTDKNKIVFIPLLIYYENKEINHMNMIYFIKDKIYHFDPYGTFNNDKLKINSFSNQLVKTLNGKFTYINPEKYLNKIELQYFEENEKSVYYFNDSVNYCIIWCLLFSDIFFNNLNLKFEQVIKYTRINLFQNQINLKKLIKDKLLEFINYRNTELEKQNINIIDFYNDNLKIDSLYNIINSL